MRRSLDTGRRGEAVPRARILGARVNALLLRIRTMLTDTQIADLLAREQTNALTPDEQQALAELRAALAAIRWPDEADSLVFNLHRAAAGLLTPSEQQALADQEPPGTKLARQYRAAVDGTAPVPAPSSPAALAEHQALVELVRPGSLMDKAALGTLRADELLGSDLDHAERRELVCVLKAPPLPDSSHEEVDAADVLARELRARLRLRHLKQQLAEPPAPQAKQPAQAITPEAIQEIVRQTVRAVVPTALQEAAPAKSDLPARIFVEAIEVFEARPEVADTKRTRQRVQHLRHWANLFGGLDAQVSVLSDDERVAAVIAQFRAETLPSGKLRSLGTQRQYFGDLQSLADALHAGFGPGRKRQRWLDHNAVRAVGFSLTRKEKRQANSTTKKRDAFSPDELRLIFERPDHTYRHAYQFWSPVIALFSGLISAEIGQLHTADVREVGGVLVFDVLTEDTDDDRSVKTEHRRRLVPLHPRLLDLGFGDYLGQRRQEVGPDGWLFDGLNRNHAAERSHGHSITEHFVSEKRKLGLTSRRKAFYSFRHTFHGALVEADLQDAVRTYLMGYEASDMGNRAYRLSPEKLALLAHAAIIKALAETDAAINWTKIGAIGPSRGCRPRGPCYPRSARQPGGYDDEGNHPRRRC